MFVTLASNECEASSFLVPSPPNCSRDKGSIGVCICRERFGGEGRVRGERGRQRPLVRSEHDSGKTSVLRHDRLRRVAPACPLTLPSPPKNCRTELVFDGSLFHANFSRERGQEKPRTARQIRFGPNRQYLPAFTLCIRPPRTGPMRRQNWQFLPVVLSSGCDGLEAN